MKEEIERCIANPAKYLVLVKSKYDMQLRLDDFWEEAINQHNSNFTNREGIQIIILHHDNVESECILNNSNKTVQSTNRMCHLTHKIVRNGTVSSNGLHANMEKLDKESGILAICDMKDLDNNISLKENLLQRTSNEFACETTVNDNLIQRKEFNVK